MAKFKVHLQQYIEQTATVVVEADTPERAKELALNGAAEADWQPDDDAYEVSAYAIHNEAGRLIWERG